MRTHVLPRLHSGAAVPGGARRRKALTFVFIGGGYAGTEAFAETAGFGVAGWLVQWLSAPIAILFDALSFVFSVIFLYLNSRVSSVFNCATMRS